MVINSDAVVTENRQFPSMVAGTQIISFRKTKHKRRAKTAAQAQIQILYPSVDEVVT